MTILITLAYVLIALCVWLLLGAWSTKEMDGLMLADWTRRKEPQSW